MSMTSEKASSVGVNTSALGRASTSRSDLNAVSAIHTSGSR